MIVVDVALAMATKDMLIKRAYSSLYPEVMASLAMLVGGAMVNAMAFSGSNYLFSMLRNSRKTENFPLCSIMLSRSLTTPAATKRLSP